MRLTVLLICFALVRPPWAAGQEPARPEFEVASVKANLSGSGLSRWEPDHHGSFRAENASLKTLIHSAYGVPTIQISGPALLDSLHLDITAKGPTDAPDNQVWLMVQTLLEERLHLRVHRETKEMAVGLLSLASGGLKMKPVDPSNPAPFPPLPSGGWSLMQMTGTLPEIAANLSNFVQRPVLDRTGIEGRFRIRLYYNNSAESEGPDMYAALREQLGLRLEQGRAPVELLVVDHADQTPTEN